jgi:ACT domain-containing protein
MPSRFLSEDPYEEFFISCGSYTIDETDAYKRIIIDTLPIGVWIKDYVESIATKIGTKEKPGSLFNIVKAIEPLSKDIVNICVTMHDGWRDKIKLLPKEDKPWIVDSVDEVGLALHLYTKIYSEVNILDEFGKVVTYKKYNDMIDHWFRLRLEYYVKRVARIVAFTQIDILQAENKLRYLQNFTAMGLSGKSKEEFDRILVDNGFDKFRNVVRDGKARCSKLNTVPNELLKDLYTSDRTDDEFVRVISDMKQANIINGDLSYKYLRELRTGSVTTKGIQRAIDEVNALKKVLAEHQEPGVEYKKFRREVAELNAFVMKEFYKS